MKVSGIIKTTMAMMIMSAAGFLFAQTGDAGMTHHPGKAKKQVVAAPDSAKKDPAAAKKTLAPQTTCPVMGGAVNKKYFVDYNGKRIFVCCPGCIDELKSDPEKYIKKLAEMGQGVETIADSSKAVEKKTVVKEKK